MDQTHTNQDDALQALTAAAGKAAAHPGVAAPLRELLPALVAVIEHQAQQLRELRQPCPCEKLPALVTVQQLGGDGFPIPAIA